MAPAFRFGCMLTGLLLAACAPQYYGVSPDLVHAEVQTSGRTQRTAEGWQVTWPAVAWRTAFSGTSIGIDSQDLAGYHVEIDGQPQASVPATPTRRTTWYRGLAPGPHAIEVIRMGATPRTPETFYGFALDADGRWLRMHAPPARQLLVLGDSSATGYGDLSASVDCPDNVLPLTDASQSYAVLAARSLHADWQLNAMDGIGLVRNWQGIWRGTNYGTYAARTLQSDPSTVQIDAHWHPQVVLVAVGSNDLATPPGSDEPWSDTTLRLALNTAYEDLLKDLRRSLGPRALIIVVMDPSSNNPGNAIFEARVEARRADGDRRIFVLPIPAQERTGCNNHPSLADHRRLGTLLANFIQDHGGFEGSAAGAY